MSNLYNFGSFVKVSRNYAIILNIYHTDSLNVDIGTQKYKLKKNIYHKQKIPEPLWQTPVAGS